MATRPPGTSARTKKSATAGQIPPQQPRDDEQASSNATRDRTEQAPGAEVQVTQVRLEQREIPSFSESRELRIAEAAYWRAERRGFAPGYELEDWLEAEREIDEKDDRLRADDRS